MAVRNRGFVWKVRERTYQILYVNVEVRKPQEVEPHGRIDHKFEMETPNL